MRRFSLFVFSIIMSIFGYAYDFEKDGIYYSILSTDDLTVEVTNSGLYDNTTSSNDYIGSIVIPESVIFAGKNLKVVKIGGYAFSYCKQLHSVVLPNSITEIDYCAFQYSGLTSITIPSSVTKIGTFAFGYSNALKKAIFSDGNNTIDIYVGNSYSGIFRGCPLEELYIGRNVGRWDDYNSYSPFGLHELAVDETSITIGGLVTNICKREFAYAKSLKEIILPTSITFIGEGAFVGCSNLSNIVIPENVTKISKYSFQDCSHLSKVTMSNSISEIEEYAFAGCVELNDIVLSASLTQIKNGLFKGCSGLESIIIEDNIESIGEYAFADCSKLKTVEVKSGIPATAQDNSFSISSYWDGTLVVPLDCSNIYKQAPVWKKFEHIEESSEPASNFIYAASISLNKTSATVTEGNTLQLTATVLPTNATNRTVTWKSSDEAVATVDSTGLVTAVALGSATITATTTDGSNLNASCNVTVLQGIVLAESIKLNVTTAGLNEGSTLQLTATVLPEECAGMTVLWSSNNPSVATVDGNGLVTTHSVGTATITVMTSDGSNLSTTCTVTLLPVGVKGDVNGDNSISISDVTSLIDYLLSGAWN